ncbi:ABC transporter ATP-binding protein [Oceanirhabdus sp. W0125-5]|uniref:ABC transporter ATP-binding protein n=1 Tax=Oceanirhabdus sp. W0125-5 TaxID=2999116 RepID=UPI0022F309A6|nr:ABC transporter ATP-binding protein [Oceanirhabdus sp. W0125-5]WBW97177.1 ABC transporter ATP-binding protein [Oceanirhabdus sp. W0125-5]
MESNRIEFKNITKRYDDKLVIDNLSFSIEKGKVFGLLGPNGAGKSTIISMLCGIVAIDKGDIAVQGYSVIKDSKKVKSFIGYVPQELALFENLSIMDNLNYFAGMYGLKKKVKKERISEALQVTALEEQRKMKVKKLSGGMKRRLNIACAIMHHPEILIMDEPTVGIDPQSRNHILEFALKMNKKHGMTIIYTSHYMEEIQKICNEILVIDNGKEIISGTKDNILKSVINETTIDVKLMENKPEIINRLKKLEGVREAYYDENLKVLVASTNYKIEDVLKTIKENKGYILNISINEPNLETVFLSLTGKKLRD